MKEVFEVGLDIIKKIQETQSEKLGVNAFCG